MKPGERMRLLVALGVGVALHALLLLIPRSTPVAEPKERFLDVDLTAGPPPRLIPPRAPAPSQALEALPSPPPEAASLAALPPPEALPPDAPSPAVRPALPPRPDRAVTSVRLMAEPLLEDRDDPVRLFGPGREPAPTFADYRVPERQGLDDLLATPLPDLPFADPQLVDFMYAPGPMGEAHRLFDKATPVFGWTSNTGFKIRCRFVLVIVACGWGR